MTPDDFLGDVPESVLKRFGAKTPEELEEIAEKHRSRTFFDRRQSDKIDALQAQIADLTSQLEEREVDEDFGGASDETTKRLMREVRKLKQQQSTILGQMARTPEDDELEPWLNEARQKYPEIVKSIPDPLRRLDAYRRLARSLKSEAETGANADGSRRQSDASHAMLSGSGAPVSTRSGSPTNPEEIQAKFSKDLKAAKTKKEKEAVYEKYHARYPEVV